MKTLQNIGWFVLAFLSFLMVYSFIQGVALLGLGAGVPIYGILPLYILLAGVYCFFVYKWYKMSPVTIGTTGFNRYIWLPALVSSHCCSILFTRRTICQSTDYN